jgi:hypothetical protein
MPKEKYDYEILEEAMDNAYGIIVGEFTFDYLIEKNEEVMLPFDIRDEEPDIDGMIEYFITTEEYEKCAKLTEIKTNKLKK